MQGKNQETQNRIKKIRDKRETTGQGRYPEWEYLDAINEVFGPKHSTEPPVLVESFSESQNVNDTGPDDETQDMSGEAVSEETVPSPAPSHTSGSSTTDRTVVDGGDDTHESGSKGKPRKRKLGKREATNEHMEKMIEMQEKSDKLMMTLEEKRMKMEERQMELDAQMHREERDFQLKMMQILSHASHPGPPPLTPHYPTYSNFSHRFDPDATQDGL